MRVRADHVRGRAEDQIAGVILKIDVAHTDPIDGEQHTTRALVDERKREVATDRFKEFVVALQPSGGYGSGEGVERSGTAPSIAPCGMALNCNVDGP